MASDCPHCGVPAFGRPSYNPRSDLEPPIKRFNCPSCGNTWEEDMGDDT